MCVKRCSYSYHCRIGVGVCWPSTLDWGRSVNTHPKRLGEDEGLGRLTETADGAAACVAPPLRGRFAAPVFSLPRFSRA